jgi:L-alanine-DL-glutamate epimerase-like enolase superfamily enzyme
VRIARALEPIKPLWIEDPVSMDHMGSIAAVARSTTCPIAVGETRGMRADYRYLLELNALALVIMDLSWCGGISEAGKIAATAETFHIPVAFHDCSGPVVLTASVHMALHTRNCFVQEIVRAFYYGWYSEVLTHLPPISKGQIGVPEGPGLGVELRPDLVRRADCTSRRTTAADL